MTTEYLTVLELSAKIKYTEQSIYNLINKNIFIQGVHYYKPTPKKILFKWGSIINWIEGNESMSEYDFASTLLESNTRTDSAKKSAKKNEPISSICI
jgi:hypothetical protein